MSFFSDLVSKFRTPESGSSGSAEVIEEERVSDEYRAACSEYIAAACHYDDETLLNRGGELVQIIRVEDYMQGAGPGTLREKITQSIESVRDPRVSFWVYTVREKKRICLEWKETNDFSDGLHHRYRELIDQAHETYVNEVYVAIVIDHLDEGMRGMFKSLLFGRVIKKHKSFLAAGAASLSKVSAAVMEALEGFVVRKLSLIECENGQWRSELLEFLNYLVTLKRRQCFLERCDSAHTIAANCDLSMGFNAFRVSEGDETRYGAILGIKQSIGANLDAVASCLQQACEFVVVEVIRFIENKELKDAYRRQATLIEISGDKELAEISCMSEIMGVADDSFGESCQRKMSCMVSAANLSELRQGIARIVEAFSTVGAVVVRLDLAMEDSFWSNMPGSFRYVLGLRPSLVKLACTYAMLHDSAVGAMRGGRWSEAITLFFSNKGLPYFFNFHVGGNGHTVCVGPQDSNMTSLLNFILSEARRLRVKSVVFDYSGKSIIYVTAVGGKYHRVDDRTDRTSVSFNPFNVKDNKANRTIAEGVILRMVAPMAVHADELKKTVKGVVSKIFAIPLKERVKEKIDACLGDLGGQIANWIESGKYAHIVKDSSEIDWNAETLAVNAGMLVSKLECVSAVLYYMLRMFEQHRDGSPTILVLHEAWLVDVVFPSEEEFDEWINRLSKLNVVVVFAAENISAIASSRVIRYSSKHVDTRIFMPNFIIGSKQHVRLFGLGQEELDDMLQIAQQAGHFFVKQGSTSVVLSYQVAEQDQRVLSANRDTIKHMYSAIAEKGADWIETFHAKCEQK